MERKKNKLFKNTAKKHVNKSLNNNLFFEFQPKF